MITYKYCVHDDDHNILDKCFDNFADAFDYAQKGLITFIEEVPFIDGVEDEDNSEVVWTWDDVRDRDAAINYVCNRHRDFDDFDTQIQSDELISSEYDYPIDEDISVEVEADDPEDLAEFARCILGDNFESFDQEFDEIVPDAEIKLEPREVSEDLNDNAVKDCKNYELVAHCKEEKPVCNIEKPVLPDELTDPDLDMTDEEFYEAFGKALKDKVENK